MWLHSSWIEEVRVSLMFLRFSSSALESGVCCFRVLVLLVFGVMYVDSIFLLMCTSWLLISGEGTHYRILVLGFTNILYTSHHVY